MQRHRCISTENNSERETITSSNRQNKESVTNPNKMAICELSDQEFKITVSKKLGDLKITQKKQFINLLEKFKKEIEIFF